MNYESPDDLAHEARIAETFRVAMGFTSMVKPPKPADPYACVLDRYFYDAFGVAVACCEIKKRDVPFNKYSTLNIDKKKCWVLKDEEHWGKIASYLIIEWTDAIGWVRPGLWEWHGETAIGINGGMWGDPNRPNSMRQAFFIPRGKFTMMTEWY